MTTKRNVTALIYDKRGRILSIGKNSYIKTHPLQFYYASKVNEEKKVYLHAEIDAIIKCRDISKAHKMVVTRVCPGGHFGNAKPCIICTEAIKDTPIKYVEHT